jgi:putative Ca2+/H+ antiporter (TMEM165/GDT1 family)
MLTWRATRFQPSDDSLIGGITGIKGLDLETPLGTFGMTFVAELCDKTQLAMFAFAIETKCGLAVFRGSASALVLTSFLAVMFGSSVSRMARKHYIRIGAAALFILLSLWMLLFPARKCSRPRAL